MTKTLRIILFAFFSAILVHSNGQTTIAAQWSFNNSNTTPNLGNGTILNLGGITSSYVSGNGSTDPTQPGQAYATTNYPAANSSSGSAGVRFVVSTRNLKDIVVSFDQQNTSNAASTIGVYYSFEGIIWQTIPAASFTNNTAGVFITRTVDFSSVTAINNFTEIYFKIATVFTSPGAVYTPTTTGSTYAGAGTIAYDRITVKGNTINCGTMPTTKATPLHHFRSEPTYESFKFSRGNGAGAIVLMKANSTVDAPPVDGISYLPNTSFGTGAQVGNGNFIVHKSTDAEENYFSVNNLIAGQIYGYAIYEYSSAGNCYSPTPTTGWITGQPTILQPGDMQFIGWDASVDANGADRFYLMSNVDIKPGTTFGITNGVYEINAPANTRTNRWYGGGNSYTKPFTLICSYNSPNNLAKGSILAFNFSGFSTSNLSINGAAAPTSTSLGVLYSDFNAAGFLTGTPADNNEQLFLFQGSFASFGTENVNMYHTLSGKILSGFAKGGIWVSFNNTPSLNSKIGRVPPDIQCTKLNFPGIFVDYATYLSSGSRSGSIRENIANVSNLTNWGYGSGSGTVDNVIAFNANNNNPFTINTGLGYYPYDWVNGSNKNWFDCNNWFNYAVPDASSVVNVLSKNPFNEIDITTSNSALSGLYKNKAEIESASFLGTILKIDQNDSLTSYGFLTIGSNSTLNMNLNGGGNNKVIMVSNAGFNLNNGGGNTCEFGNQFTSGTNSEFVFRGQGSPKYIGSKYTRVANFTIDIDGSLFCSKATVVTKQLNLKRGIIKGTGLVCSNWFGITSNTVIASPVINNYGNDQGYNKSFIDLPIRYEANSTANKFLPIGKDTVFAPVQLKKQTAEACTYLVMYNKAAPVDRLNIGANMDHISEVEFWDIGASEFSTASAPLTQVGLSWRPQSRVTALPTGNWQDSICVAHYYNPGSGNTWLIERDVPFNIVDQVTGNLSYGMVQTNRYVGNFSPFTLGAMSRFLALPVNLVSFNVRKNNALANTQWTVAHEVRMQTYVVQHSTDGQNFSDVFSLAANNNAGIHSYAANGLPFQKGNNFYRLKMIDQQQAIRYSDVKQLMGFDKASIVLFPNPAKEKITLQTTANNGQYRIVDVVGRTILQGIITGNNTNIAIGSIAAGAYWLQVQNAEAQQVIKFIKQ
jgi:hypothetical protein